MQFDIKTLLPNKRPKLSVKLLIISLAIVSLLSVSIISLLSLSFANTVQHEQQKLKETTALSSAQSDLEKLANRVLDNTLSSSSAQTLEMLANSRSIDDASQRFNEIFATLSSSLNSSKLDTLPDIFKKLLSSSHNVRVSTEAILKNRDKLVAEVTLLEARFDQLQKNTASLVGKINLISKRGKRKLKRLIRNENIATDPELITRLITDTQDHISGDQDKLATEAKNLTIRIATLSVISQKLIAASNQAAILDLEKNQAAQILQDIEKAIGILNEQLQDNASLLELNTKLTEDIDSIVNILFGNNGSIRDLRSDYISQQQTRVETIGTMLQSVNDLSTILSYVSTKTSDNQQQVITTTEENISAVITYNTIVLIFILIVLVSASIAITRMISKPISEVTYALAEISSGDGDLTKRLEVKGVEEMVVLSGHFNNFVTKLQALIKQVANASNKLNTTVADTKVIATNTKEKIVSQQSETSQLSEAVEGLKLSFTEVADRTKNAQNVAEDVAQEATESQTVVSKSVQSVEELAEKIESGVTTIKSLSATSQNVVNVLEVIKNIADQTNLLALNAAIEAARAGEQGRGFSVVADEVRALASKTQDSTTQISEILETLKTDAESATKVMFAGQEQAKSTVEQSLTVSERLNTIVSSIKSIADLNQQIASAVQIQSKSVNEATNNVERINIIGAENSDASVKIENSSESLSELAIELNQALSQFKI
ncbi:methyl-accepting chemotaxis protein [Marinomonas agarivorans]|nr:methyl-accepting chemotaxis protein [Marinomonas agarivorans]